jgi:tetratricopeptide (TPR) repeat protein
MTELEDRYEALFEFVNSEFQKDFPNYEEVTKKLKEAIPLSPNTLREKKGSINVYYYLGLNEVLKSEKDYLIPQESIQYFEKVVEKSEKLLKEIESDNSIPTNKKLNRMKEVNFNISLSKLYIISINEEIYPVKFSVKEYQEEIQRLSKFKDLDPEVSSLVGTFYLQLNNIDEAIFYFDQAIELSRKMKQNPNIYNIPYYKGVVFYEKQKFDHAYELFIEYQIKSNKDATDYLAACLLNFGKHDAAFEKYCSVNSNQISILNGIAICSIFLNREEEAKKCIDKTLRILELTILPEDSNTVFNKLDKFTRLGRKLTVESLSLKGLLLLRDDQKTQGILFIDLAIKIVNRYSLDMVTPDFFKGIRILEQEKYYEAIEYFKNILDKKPNFSEAHYALGIAYANIEEYDDSLNEIQKAIRQKPTLTSAYIHKNKIESIKKKNIIDIPNYWTKSNTRKATLVILILFAAYGGLIGFLFPDTESTVTTSTNVTKTIGNEISPHEKESIVKTNTKLGTFSLIIIIAVVIIIIWPTIQSIKVGKESVEIEKITYPESTSNLGIDYLDIDNLLKDSIKSYSPRL